MVLLGLVGYIGLYLKPEKKAYIQNQQVFGSFKGTLQLEKKLKALKEQHAQTLDSIHALLPGNEALAVTYETLQKNYVMEEQALSDKYTGDLWKDINLHLAVFGKEQGYDFIFGATGNGTIMFANDAHDATREVIEYINTKYEGD